MENSASTCKSIRNRNHHSDGGVTAPIPKQNLPKMGGYAAKQNRPQVAGDLSHLAEGHKRPRANQEAKREGKCHPAAKLAPNVAPSAKDTCFHNRSDLRWIHPAEDRATQGCDLSADLGAGGLTAPLKRAGRRKLFPALVLFGVGLNRHPAQKRKIPRGVRGEGFSPNWQSFTSTNLLSPRSRHP